VNTLEQLAEAKRVVVEVARDVAVLNADDHLCLQMADYTKAKKLCYVTMNPRHALVKEHIRQGGMALVLEQGINGDMITIYDNGSHTPLLWTHLIPATIEGKAVHNVQNAMFAAALSYAMDKELDQIRHGLRTFDSTFFQAPGRMNQYDEHPFKVILDYGHNPAAISMVSQTIDRFDVHGEKIVVLSAPGDRRDQDINDIAKEAAGHFDRYILKADDNRRGRGERDVPLMLQAQLVECGINIEKTEVIADEVEAIDFALASAQEGDLLLIFGDAITRCWKQIIHFNKENQKSSKSKDIQSNSNSNVILDEDEKEFLASANLIKDEKGVRLARAEEND
jgi:cyanophycin synthetase